MSRSALLHVMIEAARKAGRALTRDFNEVEHLQVSVKGPGNFVTAADTRAEQTLHHELSRARPGYGFLMEESGVVEGDDKTHRWIIDPLDGTTNFMHGLPLFAISIALEREGVLQAGVIYNPVMDEMFVAERGKGAFFNDRRLRVSGRKHLSEAVATCGIPHLGRGNPKRFMHDMAAVMPAVAGIRRTGSAALDLAFVAAGRFDFFWEYGLAAWDVAAGVLMVREAGGTVTDSDGQPFTLESPSILAGNEALHAEAAKLLQNAKKAAS